MATRFEHNGNLFEIIQGTDEVVLVRIPQSSKGEIVLPKYAMYGDKRYAVTQIGGIKESYYKWVEDKRKRAGGEWKYDREAHPCLLNKRSYVSDNGGLAEASNITSLFIPDGVKRIGNCAFSGCCKGMKKLTIPDSVVSIGYSAFWGCENIESLTIPDSVITIGHAAFYACHSLKKLVLSKKVKEINRHTFWSDKNEVKVSIPSSVEVIGEWAFSRKLQTVDIYNDMGEVLVAGNAFPPDAKVTYLGKKELPKPEPEKKETPQPEQSATVVSHVTIDLDKLIEAVIADGVITDKERSVIIKKATAAGYDADEVEILLDGKLAEKLSQSVPNTPVVEETKPVAKPEEKTSVIQEEKPATDTVKSEVAKKETSTKSKSKQSSASYEDYVITINEDKSISVTLKGNLCDNTKKALREIAELVGFEYDKEWTTRQLGSKLIDFLNEK